MLTTCWKVMEPMLVIQIFPQETLLTSNECKHRDQHLQALIWATTWVTQHFKLVKMVLT